MLKRAVKSCFPTRALFLGLGWFFLLLGIVGAFVPVMPSMIPLLVALWAFSKGSQRFHDWLYEHRHLGPPLKAWCEHRVIEPRSKLIAILSMVASLGVLIVVMPAGSVVPLVYGGLTLFATLFVLSRPSRLPVSI